MLQFGAPSEWVQVRDGHPHLRAIYNRHYSSYRYRDGRQPALTIGPGEKIALLTADGSAAFCWRKFISADVTHGGGVNCAMFRNEGPHKSSLLILSAEAFAVERWPGERLYTYVDPQKVASSNPGYCFQRAGWTKCGFTKSRNLLVLEKVVGE